MELLYITAEVPSSDLNSVSLACCQRVINRYMIGESFNKGAKTVQKEGTIMPSKLLGVKTLNVRRTSLNTD